MANPNIVNVSQIYGKTTGLALATNSGAFLTNTAASNKIIKVNSIYVANVNGTAAADVNLSLYDASGAVELKLANTISVPADATLVLISKDAGIYLEEGDYLYATASINSYLHLVCSYEEIS